MKTIYILLLICCVSFIPKITLSQGAIPTVGTDFWFAYMSNYSLSSESLDVFISGSQATTGTISSPLQGWSVNFNVTPGVTTTVTIPENIGGNNSDDVVDIKGIHIQTADTVSVFAINFRSYTADGTLVLPIKSLGTEYMISSYQGVYGESEMVIVATADGTEVEITPTAATLGGHPAGVTYTVQLDEGETYQVKSNGDLTGTTINSTEASGDCRPFGVFSGVVCANIPNECIACDHIYDQNYAVDTWGKKYYVAPFMNATSFSYRIFARDNGTNITVNGTPIGTFNAGQFYNLSYEANNLVIEGDKPIAVIQYMEGISCSGNGDPAMLILNSEERKINDVTFSTVSSTVITNHSLTLIVESNSTGSVLLDGAAVGAGNFTPFTADPTKSYALLDITQGSHNINLPTGFTAYAYGVGSAESYAYNVGSFLPEAIIPVDTAYCSSDSVVLSAGAGMFSPWWSTTTNPNDTILNGSTLILHPPIINDIYVVKGFSLVSGCADEKYYSVESPNPPQLVVTSSEDTVCRFTDVQMNVAVDPLSSSYVVQWTPPFMFDNPSSFSPVLNAQQSGWYKVNISTMTGCGTSTDSVYIEVLGGGVKDLIISAEDSSLCNPEATQLHLNVYQVLETDDFNGGTNTNLWNSISGGTPSDTCSFIDGDALYFNGAGTRIAETVDMNLSNGGAIEFYLEIANGVAPCDNADFGENVVLEYSTNAGSTWNSLATYFENSYPNFTLISVDVPLAAQTTATRFRWRQLSFDGIDQDNWMLENVSFSVVDTSNLTIQWNPATGLSNASIFNPNANPTVSTMYVATVSSGSCTYTDSIFIQVDQPFTLQVTPDQTLCSIVPVTLSAIPSLPGTYTYSWSPSTALSNTSNQTVTSTTTSSIAYAIQVNSVGGCSVSDSVSIYIASQVSSQIIGDTVICVGDTNNLQISFVSNANSDDFNSTISSLWSTTGGGVLNTSCGSVSGNALHFNSPNGTRFAQTNAINTSGGGTIDFQLIIGSGFSPCEDADFGENVILEYSIDNGLTWTTIQTFLVDDYPAFTPLSIPIPAGAMTNSTLFRWNQPSSSGTGSDNWAIDDVFIQVNDNTNFQVTWFDENNNIVSTQNEIGFTPANSQWFFVEIRDTVANCSTRDSVYLTINTLFLDAGNDTLLCQETLYQLNASTSFVNPLITWSNSSNLTNSNTLSPTIINPISQYYTVTLSEGTCIASDSVYISYFSKPNPIDSTQATLCELDSLFLTLNGDSNYSWNQPNLVLNNTSTQPTLIPNSYTQFILNFDYGTSCQSTDTISVNVVPYPQVSILSQYFKCPENTVQLVPTFTNVDQISWSTNQQTQTITVGQPGFYTVTGSNACTSTQATTEVLNYIVNQVNLGPDTTLCYYETIDINAGNLAPLSTVTWSNAFPGNTQTIAAPNYLTIIATDSNQCQTFDTITVALNPVSTVNLGPDFTFCSYDDATIGLSVPTLVAYLWSTGEVSSSISVDVSGTYYVLATDQYSCTYLDSITVTETPAPLPNIEGVLVYCPGETTELNLSHNYQNYTWSTGQQTSSIQVGAPFGQIWVEVEDQNNCIGSDTVTISEIVLPPFSLGVDQYICPQGFTTVNASIPGGYDYTWDGFLQGSVANLNVGTHYVDFTFQTCAMTDTIQIIAKELPVFELGNPITICPGEDVAIVPDTMLFIDSIRWSDGSTSSTFIPQTELFMFDSLYVTATAFGCGTILDSISIYVENCHCIVYIPNTFTPDNNEFNNTFQISHICAFGLFEFNIYNRWGQLIFHSTDPNFTWDGKNPDGSIAPDGTYTWTMMYEDVEDIEHVEIVQQNGHITLIR